MAKQKKPTGTQKKQIQRIIREYLDETGLEEYRMPDVVQYAVDNWGFPVPPPVSGLDQLAKRFSQAAAEVIRYDEVTSKPYRANHARMTEEDGKQIALWFDLDNVRREVMQKFAYQRRERLVGEGVQLSFDLDHWNRIHPEDEPIVLPMDLTEDIEWRKNAPDEDKEAS